MAFRKILGRTALVFALGCFACGPKPRGAITPQGYAHDDYALQVVADPQGQLLGQGWYLDNYYVKQDRRGTELVVKDSDDYQITYHLDWDGDGVFDDEVRELIYALRFRHQSHDGRIFLRTIPISTDQRTKRPKVLMARYVEEIAGAGYELVQLTPQTRVVIEKRYAAAVTTEGPALLAGKPAHYARLQVGNLDQLRLDPNARKEQVELVLLHTNFVYKKKVGSRSSAQGFPVILLIGYANQPEEFDEGLVDFRSFLSRIWLDGQSGFAIEAPTPASAEGSSEAEPPTPAPADAPAAEAEAPNVDAAAP